MAVRTVLLPPTQGALDAASVYRQQQQTYGLLTGQRNWGAPVDLISYDDDARYAVVIQNQGTGGHLTIPGVLSVGNTSVTIAALSISGALTVLGTTSLGDSIADPTTVSGLLTVGNGLVVSAAGAAITGNSSVTGTFGVSSTLTVTSGGLTVSAGGAAITGNSSVAGTFEVSSTLTVSAGGAAITGASSVTGTLTTSSTLTVSAGGLTVSAGGAAIIGNSSITGTLGVSSTLTVTAGGLTVSAGNLAVSSGTITASSTVQGTRLISTVATGTAPLTVASTTKVDNLNADFLDGFTSSDFLTGLGGAVLTDGSSQTKSGALTIQGTFSTEGNTAIGNASGDTLTVTATSTFVNDASFNGNVTLGNAGGDNLTVNASAGFAAAATFDSNVTLGNAAGDTITVTGTATFAQATEVNNTLTAQEIDIDGSGTVFVLTGTSQHQSTVGAAGGASALPATPKGYIKISVDGDPKVIPYYDAS